MKVRPGIPDGFRVDINENIWTSAKDGVHCYDASGKLLGKILIQNRLLIVLEIMKAKHYVVVIRHSIKLELKFKVLTFLDKLNERINMKIAIGFDHGGFPLKRYHQ